MRAELAQAQEALQEAESFIVQLTQQQVTNVEERKASLEREKELHELACQRDKERHRARQEIAQLQSFNAVLTQEIAQLRAMLLPGEHTPDSGKGKWLDFEWAQSDLGAPVSVSSAITNAQPAASLEVRS